MNQNQKFLKNGEIQGQPRLIEQTTHYPVQHYSMSVPVQSKEEDKFILLGENENQIKVPLPTGKGDSLCVIDRHEKKIFINQKPTSDQTDDSSADAIVASIGIVLFLILIASLFVIGAYNGTLQF